MGKPSRSRPGGAPRGDAIPFIPGNVLGEPPCGLPCSGGLDAFDPAPGGRTTPGGRAGGLSKEPICRRCAPGFSEGGGGRGSGGAARVPPRPGGNGGSADPMGNSGGAAGGRLGNFFSIKPIVELSGMLPPPSFVGVSLSSVMPSSPKSLVFETTLMPAVSSRTRFRLAISFCSLDAFLACSFRRCARSASR